MKRLYKPLPPPPGTPRGYVTVRRAMEVAGVSEPTIWRWIRTQLVAVQRVRSRVVLREADLRILIRPRRYVPERNQPLPRQRRTSLPPAAPACLPYEAVPPTAAVAATAGS